MRFNLKKLIMAFSIVSIMCYSSSCKEMMSDKNEVNTVIKEKGISSSEHDVKFVFINAGKADSALVMIDDKSYLIDTGLKSSVSNIRAVFDKYNIKKLDGVFLTHTHNDHIGGLKKVSKSVEIEKVYSANISFIETDGTNKIDESVSELGLNHEKLDAKDVVNVDDDVNFVVLGPIEYNEEDDNDNSLVLRLNVNGVTTLFTGDMQFDEERTLINAGINLDADILKVGNHGNKDATSEEFIKEVTPKEAIISTDTSVDTNSANKKVKKRLGDANIYITQDFELGVEVEIKKDSTINIVK